MILIYMAVAGLVLAFWLGRTISQSGRKTARFAFNVGMSPAAFHGIIREDPTPAVYGGDPAMWPAVTVLVPGRNEGHVLAQTLGSLCAMDYPNYRVVFIDDQSSDNTAAVCRELEKKYPHLRVIHNVDPPPAGWVGKSWAIHQARDEMTGDYLLFTDSDLHFHRDCLRQMIRLALHRRLDLASLLPRTDCRTIGEYLGIIAGLQLIGVAFPLSKSNNPKWPYCIVAGGFMLFKREAYETLGGHEEVRGQLIEDIALGMVAKSRGMNVFTVGTRELLSARMYEGWADTFRGLKKNAYAGASYNPLAAVVFVLLLMVVGVMLPVYPVWGVLWWVVHPGMLSFAGCVVGILIWVMMLQTVVRDNRLVDFPDYLAWLTPAASGFFLAVFVVSVIDHYRGGSIWSGRKYHADHVATLESLLPNAKPADSSVRRTS